MTSGKIDICVPTLDKTLTKEKLLNVEDFTDYIPVNNIIFSTAKGLANSRNELINKVTTEWFIFLDDDVKLNKQWWLEIKKHMVDDEVGAVNGLGYCNSFILKSLRNILFMLRGTKEQRGFTSNTLIRTKAVKGIKLERVGRLEDAELQQKIINKGYKWVHCPKAVCEHLKKPITVWKESCGDFKTLWKEKGFFKAVKSI